jgi:hypothetical protein
MKRKDYLVLDPITLGFVKGSAEVGSRFETTIMNIKMRGNLYSVFVNGARQRAYVTDKGDLVKVDLTEDTYLQVDAVPGG